MGNWYPDYMQYSDNDFNHHLLSGRCCAFRMRPNRFTRQPLDHHKPSERDPDAKDSGGRTGDSISCCCSWAGRHGNRWLTGCDWPRVPYQMNLLGKCGCLHSWWHFIISVPCYRAQRVRPWFIKSWHTFYSFKILAVQAKVFVIEWFLFRSSAFDGVAS